MKVSILLYTSVISCIIIIHAGSHNDGAWMIQFGQTEEGALWCNGHNNSLSYLLHYITVTHDVS